MTQEVIHDDEIMPENPYPGAGPLIADSMGKPSIYHHSYGRGGSRAQSGALWQRSTLFKTPKVS